MSIKLDHVKTGQVLTAEMINAPNRAIDRMRFLVSPDSGIEVSEGAHNVTIWKSQDRLEIWAKIIDHTAPSIAGTSGPYAWREQYAAINGTWVNGARFGSTTFNPAYEQNSVTTVIVGTIFKLSYHESSQSWTFQSSPCP